VKFLIKIIEKDKFLENCLSDCQNLLYVVTTSLPIISVFLDGIGECYTTTIYRVEWRAVQWKQSLRKIVNNPLFPHLLSDFGEIQHMRSACNGVKHLWALWNSSQGRPYLLWI